MNTIREFLETREAEGTMHIGDLAEFGVMNVAHKDLMYDEDIINFFDDYEDDIEAVITDYIEGITGDIFYDLTDMELLEELNEYTNTNTSFTTTDEMLELLHDEASKQAEEDNTEEWEDMDEEEQEDIIMDYMEDLEVLPTEQDKVNFVCLAVELVAQDIIEDRDL